MSAFGDHTLLDHPFIRFHRAGGGFLHLPCGTIPTALEEEEDGTTKIVIMTPGLFHAWHVTETPGEVQARCAIGARRLSCVPDGPEVIPFPSDDDPPPGA